MKLFYTRYTFVTYILEHCTTNAGPSSNIPCALPFIFNETVYNKCDLDSDGYWCSTKVDSSGKHVGGEGNWGICSPGCPGVPGMYRKRDSNNDSKTDNGSKT